MPTRSAADLCCWPSGIHNFRMGACTRCGAFDQPAMIETVAVQDLKPGQRVLAQSYPHEVRTVFSAYPDAGAWRVDFECGRYLPDMTGTNLLFLA